MPKNAFIFMGPPTSGKTTHTLFLGETIRGKILRGRDIVPELAATLESSRELVPDNIFVPALKEFLGREVVPNIVLDNIPRSKEQAKAVSAWAKEHEVNLHIVRLDLTESEVIERAAKRLVCCECGESYHPYLKPAKQNGKCDKDGFKLVPRAGDNSDSLHKSYNNYSNLSNEVTEVLGGEAKTYNIPATGTVYETAERMFRGLSPVIFYKGEMADGYYKLRRSLGTLSEKSLFISGMPTFIYGGRALMKDFDILVPDDQIKIIATDLGLKVGEKHSSVANTRFVDISPGVEIDSNLVVKYDGGSVMFDFDFLWEEARVVRFMGLECTIMGLEDLILLKAALGRQGIDDFGKFKSDLSDMEGLLGAQNVNYEKLRARADKLGMLEKLEEKLKIIKS